MFGSEDIQATYKCDSNKKMIQITSLQNEGLSQRVGSVWYMPLQEGNRDFKIINFLTFQIEISNFYTSKIISKLQNHAKTPLIFINFYVASSAMKPL